ncbi:DUF3325 family protein [Teichococcus aestuarii]|uniref:Tat pathway signal protein n=1 Tax=Teichococcus aestuarii TaxID=568898 RepID=A0A2U1V0T5_9PROT|nr:DUF3325 family protein [Pseudoroseomonas aestuarii]PWC27522.1 Tat pathway signal protein [Pseudoroseomonas aestuarii]
MMAFALAYSGFTALCLAMARHHEQILGRRAVTPRRRRLLSGLGFLLLAAALASLVLAEGWGMGTLLWLGLLTTAANLLVLSVCYMPRAAPAISAGFLVLGLVSTLAGA